MRGNWNYPTAIRFGAGRIGELPSACRELGMRRPLLVTDPGLAALPMIEAALAGCRAAGLDGTAVFAEVRGNPVGANVEAGVTAYRQGGHDGVIAWGGGSALDAGKAIALMVGQARPLWDFEDRDDWYTRVDVAGMAPVIAVPTTSGTGSEVGRASVITDERDHVKKIIFHPRMLPALVIADPELTLGLPARLTAAVGIDALSHNLEAWCSPLYHPLAQGIALEGIRLVHDWLPAACADGSNLEARSQMMAASTMGATAFQKGLGAMHSMAHPCGAVLDTHHGLTIAIVMPYVLAFNRPAIGDRLAALARYLALPGGGAGAVLDWILDLRERIGIPHTLAALGVTAERVPLLARMAAADPSTGTNPVQPVTAEQFEALFHSAIEGRL
ncbi:MAG: iron-containing alcohol dehydrogenase [Gammaproteobacteria bacterium]|nr:MAG: iron-containing alcohol dehydrogenase [Gammaproteobacteria bacterium]